MPRGAITIDTQKLTKNICSLLPSHLKLIGMCGGYSRGQSLIMLAEDALTGVCRGK